MSEWQKVNLGDCCEITSSKRIFFSEYVESGIPFYRSKEIIEKGKGEEISHPLYISKEKYDEIKGKYGVPQKGDLLLTAVGSLGIPFVVKDDTPFYFKDGNLVWLKHFQNIDPIFLYYWIKSENGYNALYNIAIGSAQKALTIAAIKGYEIPLPPLQTQHRIATILSRYDSLIENYQKQIKLLEEAAQRLYKEWFIDLHFPGHENTNIIDGVPEGWEKKSITDVLEIKYGKDHKLLKEGTIPVYGTGGIMRYVEKSLFTGESVLIPRKGSLNNIMLVGGTFWTIDTMFYSIPKENNVAKIVYFYLKGVDMYSFNIGAAVPSMTVNILSGMKLLVPNEDVKNKFDTIESKYFIRMHSLQSQLRLLTEARDRLLPKLMSGEITV
ncbi:MAG: restriction endonuclease subunit S [Prevotellaceae bacterium]|nr:restriction endonuclease subunit S [Prevotellaceae bacterium]